jgi:hypothetical protein
MVAFCFFSLVYMVLLDVLRQDSFLLADEILPF